MYRPLVRELRFDKRLPVPPDVAWRWITEPELMNRWSEARITSTSGDTREVLVRAFGLRSRLRERILEVEPPRRFVYRVVNHPTIRDHRGELSLRADTGGSALTWTVRFRGVVPGLSVVLAAILEPALTRSLDALERELSAERAPPR